MKPYITPETMITKRLNGKIKPKFDIVIMSFHGRPRSQMLVDRFNAKSIGLDIFYKIDETDVYECTINDKKVGILRWCTGGGPITAVILEELAYLGVKYVIGYGAAASIDENIYKGEQVIADSSISFDGTSKFYNSEKEVNASNLLLDKAKEYFKSTDHKIKYAKAVSIDAFYRETEELVSSFRQDGAEILNWETSSFYSASKFLGIETLWMGHISDRLVNDNWEEWFSNRDNAHKISSDLCYEFIDKLTREI